MQTDAELLESGQTEGVGSLTRLELQWEDAHSDEIAPVDSLETLGDDGLDAEEVRTLRSPVSGAARAVLFAGQDDQRMSFRNVLLSSLGQSEGLHPR